MSCDVMSCAVCPGGDTIKSINQQSGAHVELQRNPPHNTDPNVRIFSIRGTPQQMELARQLIDDKIGVSSCLKKFPQAQVPLTLDLPFDFVPHVFLSSLNELMRKGTRNGTIQGLIQPINYLFSYLVLKIYFHKYFFMQLILYICVMPVYQRWHSCL